jgi:hypothetical protein
MGKKEKSEADGDGVVQVFVPVSFNVVTNLKAATKRGNKCKYLKVEQTAERTTMESVLSVVPLCCFYSVTLYLQYFSNLLLFDDIQLFSGWSPSEVEASSVGRS